MPDAFSLPPEARAIDRLPVAVIGAGRWGSHLIRQFLDQPRSQLVAVAEPNRDLWAAASQRYGDRPGWSAVTWLAEGQAAIARDDVAAVVIATPATTHVDLVTAALKAGKHVLVEKPLTIDPAEGDRLCELARSVDRLLMVDHTYLFHPAIERGQTVVDRGQPGGQLGRIYQGYAARTHLGPVRPDVDALWDLAIHDLAIFNAWLGETPIAVAARGQSWLQDGLADLVWLDLRYPSGVPVTIQVAWHDPHKQRRLVLSGDRGALIFDELNSAEPLVLQTGQFDRTSGGFTPIDQRREVIAFEPRESLGQVCATFLADALQWQMGDRSALDQRSTGPVGVALTRVLATASRSLANGGAWLDVA